MADTEKTFYTHNENNPTSDNHLEAAKPVDTVHDDEAVRVLNAYHGEQTWTEEEEKKLCRKIDWKLMPILCATYSLQYYDKATLSQAVLFGFREDLGLLTGNRYSFTASIFYLGMLAGVYPAMMLAQRYPLERVACGIVTLWGVCLICTTVCTNYQGIYAQRFFLGLLEAGISPMFMLLVGSFYNKNEQAFRMGIWYSCTGWVTIFSPLVNYGFGTINGGKHTWRYMYYFAGGLTTLWGLCLFLLLPPDPVRARGFTDRERYIMVARLRSNNSGVRNTYFKVNQAMELFSDIKFWLMFAIAFLCMIVNGPSSTFSGLIIQSFGFSSLSSLLLLIPLGFYSGLMQCLLPFLASRVKNARAYLIVVAQTIIMIGALLLWLLPRHDKGGLMFGVIVLPAGPGYAVVMGLQLANVAGYTKRSLASSGLYVGYCLGNFVGPLTLRSQDAPRYVPGWITVVCTTAATSVLVLVYRFICLWQNRSRDKSGVTEAFDHAYEDDVTDLKNPQFRYVL